MKRNHIDSYYILRASEVGFRRLFLQQHTRGPENTGSQTWTNQKSSRSQEPAQLRVHVNWNRLGEWQYLIVMHQRTDWDIVLCRL